MKTTILDTHCMTFMAQLYNAIQDLECLKIKIALFERRDKNEWFNWHQEDRRKHRRLAHLFSNPQHWYLLRSRLRAWQVLTCRNKQLDVEECSLCCFYCQLCHSVIHFNNKCEKYSKTLDSFWEGVRKIWKSMYVFLHYFW